MAETAAWADAGGGLFVDAEAPNRLLIAVRQAGMPDATDDTVVVTTPDGARHRSSGYKSIDLTEYAVPTDARTANLAFKAVFTKGVNEGAVSVYAFVRRHGSTSCQGYGPGNENYPTDHYDIPGMVVQTVGNLPRDGDRTWSPSYNVPLENGKFDFSWGYRRVEGVYPQGDALGILVFLNGWSR